MGLATRHAAAVGVDFQNREIAGMRFANDDRFKNALVGVARFWRDHTGQHFVVWPTPERHMVPNPSFWADARHRVGGWLPQL